MQPPQSPRIILVVLDCFFFFSVEGNLQESAALSRLGPTEEGASEESRHSCLELWVKTLVMTFIREVKGGGGACGWGWGGQQKPQSGRIRHQDDCLVETSNFSSPSPWASTPHPPGSPFQAHTALTEGSGNRRRQNWSGVESWVSSRTLGFWSLWQPRVTHSTLNKVEERSSPVPLGCPEARRCFHCSWENW